MYVCVVDKFRMKQPPNTKQVYPCTYWETNMDPLRVVSIKI